MLEGPGHGAAPTASPSAPLYSAEAIVGHTLALTPLVGSILAATNHKRLGDAAAFRRTLLFFAVPSALLLVATAVVSDRVAPFVRLAAIGWTVFLARRFFLEHRVLFARHVAAGGAKARWYWPTLITVGLAVLGLVAVFGSEFL
jgi:hypothetical protein